MKKIILLTTFLLLANGVFGQNRFKNDNKGILYNTEKALDVRLYSFGWGWSANALFGNVRTYNRTTYYTFGLGFDLKHPKEVAKSPDFTASSGSSGFSKYIYGKQNYAMSARLGYGVKRYYSEKASKNGVALAVNLAGGASMALMIPYYLEIGVSRTDLTKVVATKYTPENEKTFLDYYQIRGKSGFFHGIGETKVIPGIYGQAAVQLDWGAFDEFLRAVEIGVQLDVFAKPLPIIVPSADVPNRPYFINFYVSLQLGKRN